MLGGAPNFRSLGGIPVAGGRIREGVLFRSGAFAKLSDEDVAVLAGLGIRTVVDLRRAKERLREPNRLPEGADCNVIGFDLANAFSGDVEGDYWGEISKSPDVHGAHAAMHRVYAAMPAALHGWLGAGFEALAKDDAAPAVIHCAVGKDRTGLVTALLLHVLGASRHEIMADYLGSAGRYPESRLAFYRQRISEHTGVEHCDEVCDALTSVDASYLEAGLAAIDLGWGGLDAYLASAGVTPSVKEDLRRLYVEPASATGSSADQFAEQRM